MGASYLHVLVEVGAPTYDKPEVEILGCSDRLERCVRLMEAERRKDTGKGHRVFIQEVCTEGMGEDADLFVEEESWLYR